MEHAVGEGLEVGHGDVQTLLHLRVTESLLSTDLIGQCTCQERRHTHKGSTRSTSMDFSYEDPQKLSTFSQCYGNYGNLYYFVDLIFLFQKHIANVSLPTLHIHSQQCTLPYPSFNYTHKLLLLVLLTSEWRGRGSLPTLRTPAKALLETDLLWPVWDSVWLIQVL